MKKRGFYKNFLSIYILLVLQNVLTLSVNLTDNIMLGAYSEISLSGVTAVNQIQFIFQQMLSAFAEGAVILGSQYFGKKDTGSIKKIGNVAMRFGIGIALILFGIVTFLPVSVMHIFTTETAIVKEGCVYLSIIRFTYLFFAVTTILLATLRTVHTRVARVDTGLTRDDAANLAQLLNRGLTFVAPQDLNPMLTASMVLAAGERLAPVVMAACALVTTGPQACLEGAQYLAKMPDVRQNLGTLLEIFSDNEAAAELIRPEGGKITATLGSDLDPAMPGACIVSKRYLAGGGLTGSVALIGSTRMEYHRLLPILNYFATKLGQSMAGQGQ